MEAPSQASLPQIALRPIRVGGRLHEGGDEFPIDRYISRGDLTERDRKVLQRQELFGPLTRENYERAIGRRPEGTVGAGFEPAYLVELGIIDAPPEGAKPAKERKPPAPATQLGEPIEYNGRLIVPVMAGRFRQFEVTDKDGALLRAARFRLLPKAQEFIDSLPPIGATQISGVSEDKPEEIPDDDDVRSGTGG